MDALVPTWWEDRPAWQRMWGFSSARSARSWTEWTLGPGSKGKSIGAKWRQLCPCYGETPPAYHPSWVLHAASSFPFPGHRSPARCTWEMSSVSPGKHAARIDFIGTCVTFLSLSDRDVCYQTHFPIYDPFQVYLPTLGYVQWQIMTNVQAYIYSIPYMDPLWVCHVYTCWYLASDH